MHTFQGKGVKRQFFLSPRSSKIIVTKEKERRKRKSEERERRRRKKKKMVALLVFIIATLGNRFSIDLFTDTAAILN